VTINVIHRFEFPPDIISNSVWKKLDTIIKLQKELSMTQEEALLKIQELTIQQEKVSGEVSGKLDALRAAIEAAGNITPAVEVALGELSNAISRTDSLIEDAITG